MKPKEIRTIHPKGWPVTFDIEPADPKLHELITFLTKLGFRPDLHGDYWQHTPDGHPICPRHNVPMTKSKQPQDNTYAHAITDPLTGEILTCLGYPSKSSPGWHIQAKSN